jgi:hypothetical protein
MTVRTARIGSGGWARSLQAANIMTNPTASKPIRGIAWGLAQRVAGRDGDMKQPRIIEIGLAELTDCWVSNVFSGFGAVKPAPPGLGA